MAEQRMQLAARFARSWLSYFVDGPPRPLSATFCMTHRCNLQCMYCNSPFLNVPEMDADEIERALDSLVRTGVRRIGFTGGEPLLRPELRSAVRSSKRRGMFTTINSNLTLYDRNKDAFDEVDLVFTSLDGDRAAHTANRGPNSFEGVLDATADLIARGIPVTAISVITGQNLAQLDALLDLADEVGFSLHLQPQVAGVECSRGSRADELTNQRERTFWQTVLDRKRAGRRVASSTLYLKALTEWQDFGTAVLFDRTTRCAGGRGFVYVDANGMGYPCIYLKGQVEGVNLLETDWHDGFCGQTPCTRCCIGPHMEFNTLYANPIRGALSALRTYA